MNLVDTFLQSTVSVIGYKVVVKQLTHTINSFYKYCWNKDVYSTKFLILIEQSR